ncbi:hypothetical protein [Persicobacter psychrovividus]|uniref:Uncharacterized protein n=1 Tax=Persicobacter psychrovividus TaxID=387638 RepID=A0ABM7VJI2_9BACT|nr:hypothetical protein PEPS_34150 [Persicobacter psychrovividus]
MLNKIDLSRIRGPHVRTTRQVYPNLEDFKYILSVLNIRTKQDYTDFLASVDFDEFENKFGFILSKSPSNIYGPEKFYFQRKARSSNRPNESGRPAKKRGPVSKLMPFEEAKRIIVDYQIKRGKFTTNSQFQYWLKNHRPKGFPSNVYQSYGPLFLSQGKKFNLWEFLSVPTDTEAPLRKPARPITVHENPEEENAYLSYRAAKAYISSHQKKHGPFTEEEFRAWLISDQRPAKFPQNAIDFYSKDREQKNLKFNLKEFLAFADQKEQVLEA